MSGIEVGLLTELAVAGVELRIDEGRVRFRAPSGVLDGERKARLSEAKEEILARVPAGVIRPLSLSQSRLWLYQEIYPESPLYNICEAFELRGSLDHEALERAFGEIVRRHEILRTTFPSLLGGPVQAVRPAAEVVIDRFDVDGSSVEERRAAAVDAARRLRERPFVLTEEPGLRVAMIAIDDDRHLLVFVVHHISFDGASFRVLFDELRSLYGELHEGRPSPLEPVAVQYGEWALEERRRFEGETLEGQLDFWRRTLEGSRETVELPVRSRQDRAGREREWTGGCEVVRVPGATRDALLGLAKSRGATLFAVLLAVFEVLLHRYSGQTDFNVGSASSSRTRSELQGLIGFFVNNLVLRADLSGDPGFGTVLERARRSMLEAFANQDVPFERLVEEMGSDREIDRNPLFGVVFNMLDTSSWRLSLSGLEVEGVDLGPPAPKFDLILTAVEESAALALKLEYRSDLFDDSTIRRMGGHLLVLVDQILADPAQSVAEMDLLSAPERRQVLTEWGRRARPYPSASTVHDLFSEVAAAGPDRVAVVAGAELLTYGELDRRSDLLALRLRRLGVRSEETVGLCVERSVEMVVAVLAILKAGAAYLSFSPAEPWERMSAMLADSSVSMLFVTPETEGVIPPGRKTPLRLVLARGAILKGALLEEDAEGADGLSALPSGSSLQLAYVSYTSGSTGRPKGVAVCHRSVVRLVRGTEFMRFGPDEIFLQLAPVAFDASTLELWGSLLHGAPLVLMPPETPTVEEVGRTLDRHRVTTAWLTAGLFHLMVEHQLPRLAGLRQLLAGGDVLSPRHVAETLGALPPGSVLINGYGPTENTTFSTCHSIAAGEGCSSAVPIGRPIPNSEVYVLDRGLQPLPVGVPGELYVGGDGLARGYVSSPALTAERFVPNPWATEPGSRLYRTGDLVRWLPDGVLAFLGRIDHQVKVRGFRVEPGEVEAVLARHPAVAQVAVVPEEEPTGGRRLVAYLAGEVGLARPSDAELRERSKETLPAFMIPAAFRWLPELPLNRNGKVDRRALDGLAAAAESMSLRASGFGRHRSVVEEMLAGIWCEALDLERVRAEDDFFDLGGHSLAGTRVISRVREVLGCELPLRSLFEAQTLERFAARVEESLAEGDGLEPAPPIEPVPRDRPLELSFAQQRLWLHEQLEAPGSLYNVPAVWRLSGPVDPRRVESALRAVAHRHEPLRTLFRTEGERAIQVILPQPAEGLMKTVDLTSADEEERMAAAEALLEREANRQFQLDRETPLRAFLVHLTADDHLLLVLTHHIVSDGWSQEVLLRDLARAYSRAAAGVAGTTEKSPRLLEPTPVQYADFAAWQRRRLAGPVLEGRLRYWTERLSGIPPVLELPTDRPRGASRTFRGDAVEIELAAPLVRGVGEVGRAAGASPFIVLFAAFQGLLGRWTGQQRFAVGVPIAGRVRKETEELIGFFVNTLALPVDLSEDPAMRDLVVRAKDEVLSAHLHQDLPFERLVEELAPERSPSHAPVFQVAFVLHDRTGRVPEGLGDEVRLEPHPVRVHTSKFDLIVALTRSGEGLRASLRYSTDLFDATTVRRLGEHYRTLLEGVVERPDLPTSELPLLSPAERQRVVREWAGAATPYPADRSVAELFARRAEERPDGVAVEERDGHLSYGELDRRSNRLAHLLADLGVRADVRVGVCVERSAEAVVALLAVLKAGGAYVPLDPAYPDERLSLMVEDSGAAVVLVGADVERRLPSPRPVILGRGSSVAEEWPEEPLPQPDGGEHLAYVTYTSGSTGRPKGIAVTHRAVVRLVVETDYLEVAPEHRVAHESNISFDAATFEIWGPLLGGGVVQVVPREVSLSPASLVGHLRRRRVDHLFLTTALFNQVALESPDGFGSLRTVLFGGEAVDPGRVRDVLSAGRPDRLLHVYGPTESTTFATWHPVGDLADDAWTVPIGGPIANTQAYVVDRWLRVVPAGVVGELVIGGDGLARGYTARPELTAERFVPHPWVGEGSGGERLYRTGDLVRRRSDGAIEFIGRFDHQVKIRGFRIELPEIEGALADHPEVQEVVVVPHRSPEDAVSSTLVAYLTAKSDGSPTAAELRSFLRGRLPSFMIPGVFVALESMPLNPNGKVDRSKLPEPDGDRLEAGHERVPPRNVTEREIAEIWAEVLKTESFGVHDAFFDLGGHSLLASKVMARVRGRFAVELPLGVMFESPTVAELAVAVEESRVEGSDDQVASLLERLKDLSDEEAEALLAQQQQTSGGQG